MRSAFAPTSQSFAAPNPSGAARPDPEIARLFSELRHYLGLPVPHVAQMIAAHPGVIAALEAGRIDLLPPWSETARIATAYIALAGLDPRPALDRLAVLMGVSIPATAYAQHAAHPVEPSQRPQEAATPVARILGRLSEAASRARDQASTPGMLAEWSAHLQETAAGLSASIRAMRAPVRWVAAAALILIFLGSAAPSGVLQASVNGLSQPISGLWHKLSGQGGTIRVIVRDGLKWIEADDPRERRSDKLPSHRS
jgi:hypothetical protein